MRPHHRRNPGRSDAGGGIDLGQPAGGGTGGGPLGAALAVAAGLVVVVVAVVAVISGVSYVGSAIGGERPTRAGQDTKSRRVSAPSDLAPTELGSSARILQVSSQRGPALARAEVERLRKLRIKAKVLISDDYAPLAGGFYVVYVGPFPQNGDGQAAAERLQARLPGSVIRDIQAR